MEPLEQRFRLARSHLKRCYRQMQAMAAMSEDFTAVIELNNDFRDFLARLQEFARCQQGIVPNRRADRRDGVLAKNAPRPWPSPDQHG